MFSLGRADAKSHGTDAAMSAGVAVGADDGRTGQADAEFGTDHVNDALPRSSDIEQSYALLRNTGT